MKWASLLLGILTLPLLFNFTPLEVMRLKTFDYFIQTPEPSGNFVILNITEEEVQQRGGYPFPRDDLAQIQIDLHNEGALGVGWVILFPQPDRFGGDEEFAQALQYSRSVLAMPEFNNGEYPKTHGTVILGPDVDLPKATGFLQNLPELQEVSAQGAVSAPVDVDNLVRRIPLLQQTPEGWVASFGTEVLKTLVDADTYQIKTNENGIEMIRVRGLPPISTDSLGRKWISWVDTPQTTLNDMDVRGKFVFIGVTAAGVMPTLATPNGLLEPHKIQAALAESILINSPFIPDYRLFIELILLCISGLLITFVINRFGITMGVSLAGTLILSMGGLGYYLIYRGFLVDVTWSMTCMTLLSLQQFYLRFRQQYKLRQQIKKQFEHYLDPRQVKQLQDNPGLLKLGGERKECTILFTDVRGFTSLSERLPPEQVTDLMNKALTIQVNAVKKYGGMVDKFIGDAMMAIFNAPIDLDMHEDRAILTAIEIKEKMKEADLGIDIGIGINSGVVMLANCGSEDRFDYTAIGSNVNLAARCESSCKTVGEDIVIAKNTAQQTDIPLIKLEPIEMKGIAEPVEIYTTIDLTNPTQTP
jgi:adenylate cyclase